MIRKYIYYLGTLTKTLNISPRPNKPEPKYASPWKMISYHDNEIEETSHHQLKKMDDIDDNWDLKAERRRSKNKRRIQKKTLENNDVQRTGTLIIERTEIYFYCALTAMLTLCRIGVVVLDRQLRLRVGINNYLTSKCKHCLSLTALKGDEAG